MGASIRPFHRGLCSRVGSGMGRQSYRPGKGRGLPLSKYGNNVAGMLLHLDSGKPLPIVRDGSHGCLPKCIEKWKSGRRSRSEETCAMQIESASGSLGYQPRIGREDRGDCRVAKIEGHKLAALPAIACGSGIGHRPQIMCWRVTARHAT
jgi:hypothetical protein